MKTKLLLLITYTIALIRTPPTEQKSIEDQQRRLVRLREEIDVMHGDSDINSPELREAFDDLIEVSAAADPTADYEEVPDQELLDATKDDPSVTDPLVTGGDDAGGGSPDSVPGESEEAAHASRQRAKSEAEDAEDDDADDADDADAEPAPAPTRKAKPAPAPAAKPAHKAKAK